MVTWHNFSVNVVLWIGCSMFLTSYCSLLREQIFFLVVLSSIKDARNLYRFVEACFLDFVHAFLHYLSRQNLYCEIGSYCLDEPKFLGSRM